MQDNEIDLNLAVNYIPLCLCVLKTITLLVCMEGLLWGGWEAGYVGVAMLLCLDRLCTRITIFDGNVILFSVFLMYFCSMVRRPGDLPGDLPRYFTACLWVFFALYLQAIYGSIHQKRLYVYFATTACFIALVPFGLYSERDSRMQRVLRSLFFTAMCMTWMYIIGIHKRRLTKPSESGVHFVVYFSPCLFAKFSVAAAFVISVYAVVMWKTFKCSQPTPVVVNTPKLESIQEETPPPEMEELTRLFHEAKQRASRA